MPVQGGRCSRLVHASAGLAEAVLKDDAARGICKRPRGQAIFQDAPVGRARKAELELGQIPRQAAAAHVAIQDIEEMVGPLHP